MDKDLSTFFIMSTLKKSAMMKKFMLLIAGLIMSSMISAQVYQQLRFAEPDFVTINSHDGINVSSITPQTDGSYLVVLYNANYNNVDEIVTNSFEWYLSYKGKRISDYYKSSIGARKSDQKSVQAWPDELPAGHEKYVTVQFGRERIVPVKDRRDDD